MHYFSPVDKMPLLEATPNPNPYPYPNPNPGPNPHQVGELLDEAIDRVFTTDEDF